MSENCELPRRIDALDQLFSFLDGHLEPGAVDERTRFCLNLAAEEVFTNMVRHNEVGNSEQIRLELDIAPERITMRLIDADVEPWDPEAAPAVDPTLPPEMREPGGLGIHLVKSSVDRLVYEYRGREMRVTVVKEREG